MKKVVKSKLIACGMCALSSSALAAPATWKPSELRVERIVNRSGTVLIKGDPVKAGAIGYLVHEGHKSGEIARPIFFSI